MVSLLLGCCVLYFLLLLFVVFCCCYYSDLLVYPAQSKFQFVMFNLLGARIVPIKAYHMYSCLISMKVVILYVIVSLHYVL